MGEGFGAVTSVAAVLAWLGALVVYDVRQHRLPNVLTLPGALVILLGSALAGRGEPALLGALALTAAYLVVHLLSPAAMGAGDVKLAVGIGALTGAFGVDAWLLSALAAPLLTAVWGIVAWRAGATGGTAVPHGPSMCVAALAAVALVVAE